MAALHKYISYPGRSQQIPDPGPTRRPVNHHSASKMVHTIKDAKERVSWELYQRKFDSDVINFDKDQ